MADQTGIEWCDSTFNPWIGCTKVSPGCDNCYAERSTPARTMGIVWGVNGGPLLTSDDNWRKPVQWNKAHGKFFAQHGRRRRVFCASLADIFDNRAPDVHRMRLWKLIAETPNLDWLLLTKRIGNALDMLPASWGLGANGSRGWDTEFKHVAIGISAVNQDELVRDLPKLQAVPAMRRFVSFEPLLGQVDLTRALDFPGRNRAERLIDWVIVGGESGPGARPMHPDWVRSLRDECAMGGLPFFFKQWGEWIATDQDACPSGPPESRWMWLDGTPFRYGGSTAGGVDIVQPLLCRAGKRTAGALLDGREHKDWPA